MSEIDILNDNITEMRELKNSPDKIKSTLIVGLTKMDFAIILSKHYKDIIDKNFTLFSGYIKCSHYYIKEINDETAIIFNDFSIYNLDTKNNKITFLPKETKEYREGFFEYLAVKDRQRAKKYLAGLTDFVETNKSQEIKILDIVKYEIEKRNEEIKTSSNNPHLVNDSNYLKVVQKSLKEETSWFKFYNDILNKNVE